MTTPEEIYSITPIQEFSVADKHIFVKREDLCEIDGARGSSVRTCYYLAREAMNLLNAVGITTSDNKSYSQINVVARVARFLGFKCVAHLPSVHKDAHEEVNLAVEAGCEIIRVPLGTNWQLIKLSMDYAKENNYCDVPLNMMSSASVNLISRQVNLLPDVKRIIVPVNKGISLAGILQGLKSFRSIPVVGITVDIDPKRVLDKYAPIGWRKMVTLIESPQRKELYIRTILKSMEHGNLLLDADFAGKCAMYLEDGDLLWNTGIRMSKNH